MQKLFTLLGPQQEITGSQVRVLCGGTAPNTIHAGIFVASGQFWGMESRRYPGPIHICNQGTHKRGCTVASQLRALEMVCRLKTPGTTLLVEFPTDETAALVQTWQSGRLTTPPWFKADGANGRWLPRLARTIAKAPDDLVVRMRPLHHTGLGAAASEVLATLLRLSGTRDADKRAQLLEDQAVPLFARLPAI